ncbi:hypothetical protein Q4E93_01155 [Flavitalea sp. BT771]|uniref:hypothetical protein n=1 Tax=Flavitalea sp. BT771 TaxID=3063329 RepID=UPI0026E3E6CD|nr:hypothetical protein [Flavitalea sp. BT771]MDO6429174.1 hypothetical protein [Flavitalea sp. BT771]MDV6218698.1 hypothetical protein [Flavitalea sp. BT771]
MNKIILLFMGILSAMVAVAQSYEGTIDYQKTRQAVAMVQLPYSKEHVEDALKEHMAKRGIRSSGMKGFMVFRSVQLNERDSSLSDLYFMTASKSRQERDVTVLTLLPVKKNQDILTRMSGDSTLIASARSFLDSLAPAVHVYSINVQANDQESVLKKAQKKQDGLINDQADLDKKIRKLEADLDDNKKQQVKQAADLQANINADDDTKNKNQRRIRRLLDDEGDLEKKLRRAKSDLDQNKIDQRQQQAEIDKQRQILDGIKARQRQ